MWRARLATVLFEPSFRKVGHRSSVHDLAAKLAYTLVWVRDVWLPPRYIIHGGVNAQHAKAYRACAKFMGAWLSIPRTAHAPRHKGFTSDGLILIVLRLAPNKVNRDNYTGLPYIIDDQPHPPYST